MNKNKIIIFSDLDGTLLDKKDYSFEKAKPALKSIKEKKIPLIFCTSKTRSEVEYYRTLLGNSDPFVVENGEAIYIPKRYFAFPFDHDRESDNYFIIELGTSYEKLVKILAELKNKTGIALKGFSDMTAREIADMCNLTLEQAEWAKQREYDEPFLILEPDKVHQVEEAIDFQITCGARFYHLTSSDKGKAVSILIELFKKVQPEILTIALGDSQNDLPMLSVVDMPILVQLEDGNYNSEINLSNLQFAEGIGPEGWNWAVLNLLKF